MCCCKGSGSTPSEKKPDRQDGMSSVQKGGRGFRQEDKMCNSPEVGMSWAVGRQSVQHAYSKRARGVRGDEVLRAGVSTCSVRASLCNASFVGLHLLLNLLSSAVVS